MKIIGARIMVIVTVVLCLAAIQAGYGEGVEDDTKAIVESTKADEAKAFLEQGEKNILASDYQGALDNFTKAIELDPKNARAYYNRGLEEDTLGDYQGAIDDFTKAIELDPKLAPAYGG